MGRRPSEGPTVRASARQLLRRRHERRRQPEWLGYSGIHQRLDRPLIRSAWPVCTAAGEASIRAGDPVIEPLTADVEGRRAAFGSADAGPGGAGTPSAGVESGVEPVIEMAVFEPG